MFASGYAKIDDKHDNKGMLAFQDYTFSYNWAHTHIHTYIYAHLNVTGRKVGNTHNLINSLYFTAQITICKSIATILLIKHHYNICAAWLVNSMLVGNFHTVIGKCLNMSN